MLLVAAVALTLPVATARAAFTQQGTKLVPTDAAPGMGHFGQSVAVSADGNTVLVGAPHDNGQNGAAWVFVRSGSAWTQQGSKLTPSDATGLAWFGQGVALSADGNTAVIGGPRNASDHGAAWIFTRSGSTWSQRAKLAPTDEAGAGFVGYSVALSADGTTALVPGPLEAPGGAAWVFTGSGATWPQQGSKLQPTGESGAGEFGDSAALSADGNTALIGGPSDNSGDGAAWPFVRSGTTWSQEGSKLTGEGGSFGFSVALSADGNEAIVGAPFTGTTGAAWPYVRSGSTWTQQGGKLVPDEETGNAHAGEGVGIAGDGAGAVIGGPFDNGTVGAGWGFGRSGSTWAQDGSKMVPSDESGGSEFGIAAALSGDGTTAVFGGSYDNSQAGAAWVFTGGAQPPPAQPPTGGGRPPPGPPGTTQLELTEITSGPSGLTPSLPTFTFDSPLLGAAATFQCRFDDREFKPCTSPHSGYNLAKGPHTFEVRAIDGGGAPDPTPAKRAFELGTVTSTRSCTLQIPWDYQFKFGPNNILTCEALSAACPAGSQCSVAVVGRIADSDQEIAWGMGVDAVASPDAHVEGWCESRTYKEWFDRNGKFEPCPARASSSSLGPSNLVRGSCSAIYYGAGRAVRGPDDERVITCNATLRISPASTLVGVAGQGPRFGVFAPGAGALTVTPTGSGSARAARAKRRKRPKPPFSTVRVRAKDAGPVTVKLKLSSAAKKTFDRKRSLKLPMKLTFVASDGTRTVKTQKLTIRQSPRAPKIPRIRRP